MKSPSNADVEARNREAVELCKAVWADTRLWDSNYAKAIDLLRGALAVHPEDVVTLTNLGAALSDIGRHREALDVLKRAEAIGSDDRNLYFNIGVVMMNLTASTRSRAKRYFDRAGELKASRMTLEAYFDPHGH